ncbi:MAG TPA: hypothetical protein VLZ83_16555 [Edaphocola sp.]|nr:hypothetical protein [Edaphocola sp.]
MGEINLTEEITNHLIGRFEGTSTRWATEVAIFDPTNQNAYPGYVDILTIDLNGHKIGHLPKITCYEVKISYSDFRSKNGHNFHGDENYYVIPKDLYDQVMKNGGLWLENEHVGIYVYQNGKLYKKKESKILYYHSLMNIDRRFWIMDNMLQRWCAGREKT